MKKMICLLLAAAMLLTLCACKKEPELSYDIYSEPEDIDVETITNMTCPMNMLGNSGCFRLVIRDDDPFNGGANACTCTITYVSTDDGFVEFNQFIDYDNDTFAHVYFTSNDEDPYLYYQDQDGAQTLNMTTTELQNALTASLFGLENFDCEITERGIDGNSYLATINCYDKGVYVDDGSEEDRTPYSTINMVMDPVTGYVNSSTTVFYTSDGANAGASTATITYGGDLTIDKTPKELAPPKEVPEAPEADTSAVQKTGAFNFAAKDLDGNLVTYSDYADAKVMMVNFWDPADLASLDQLPDLKVLYDDYKDQGLVILGVISEETDPEAAKATVKEYALDYPIVVCDSRLANYTTGYVPTTFFFDQYAEMIGEEPVIGSQTYEEWTELVASYLDGNYGTENETADAEAE